MLAAWGTGPVAIGMLLVVGAGWPPWLLMWLMVGVVLFWVKALMLLRLPARRRAGASAIGLAGYFVLWPGTRPWPFLEHARSRPAGASRLLATGLAHVAAGMVLLWMILPRLPASSPPWGVAALGMAGLSLLLHFGLLQLAAGGWRLLGVPVDKIFDAPARATSLADFWGNRWNRAFSDFARALVLRPLARRVGVRLAGLAVFLVSGLLHELVITVPAGGGYGGPTLYFLLQGLLAQSEGLGPLRRTFRRLPALGWSWTALSVLIPVPLLFPMPFLVRVVLPFLGWLGAA